MDTTSGRFPHRGPVAELLCELPRDLAAIAPDRYERIGDVVLLKMMDASAEIRARIGESFGQVLGARTVAVDRGVHGAWRQPDVEVVWGDCTETVHL